MLTDIVAKSFHNIKLQRDMNYSSIDSYNLKLQSIISRFILEKNHMFTDIVAKFFVNLKRHEYFPMPTGLDYNHHCYKVYSWKASWTVLICLFISPMSKIFVACVRFFSLSVSLWFVLSQFTFKSFCENSNSNNCHIGMASFHHELYWLFVFWQFQH